MSGRVLCLSLTLGDHPRHGLPVVTHLGGEERLIAARRPDVIFAGYVLGGEHGEHARLGECARRVNLRHPGPSVRHTDGPQVDDVRDGGPQIVDVLGGTGDMRSRRFVVEGAADLAASRVLGSESRRARPGGTG